VRIAALAFIALALATLTAVAHGAGSSNAGFKIFEVRIDGTGHRVLLKKMGGYGNDTPVDISRDGKRMLFVRGGGLPAELYVANVDDSRAKRVASNNSILTPVFSPDGRKVAFEGSLTCVEPDRCYDSDVWSVNTDGTRLRRLAKFATAPSWSADSKKLAWVGNWSITTEQGVITVGSVTGQLREREISPVDGGDEWRIVWSPRGDRLAYTVLDRERIHIARVTGGPLPDVRTPFSGSAPSWSPDGSRLAFTKWGVNAVYVARPDGRGRRWLSAGLSPLWSPNGRWIAFQQGDRCAQLYVIRPTGRGRHAVTHEPCGANYDRVVWPADSARLIYLVRR
jgi:Tol biopolymer transport system component